MTLREACTKSYLTTIEPLIHTETVPNETTNPHIACLTDCRRLVLKITDKGGFLLDILIIKLLINYDNIIKLTINLKKR